MMFEKGRSGNPKGRPKGRKDRRSLLFEQLVPHGDRLISKAVALALEGDSQMLALCINKLIGNARPVDRSVRISTFRGSLSERGEQVVKAIGNGTLSPVEGRSVLAALVAQAELVEVTELERRLEVLENAVESANQAA